MENKTFFNGALILIIFNLIGKGLGAIYRIPLAGILGGVGIGQYQLVFPLYCLILTLTTSGIPASISKMVAEFNSKKLYSDSKRLLSISIIILTSLSVLGFLIVISFSKTIATIQGNSNNFVSYLGIAPAILFVGVISAFRGYFQGNLRMFPTAFSSLIEQIFKLIFGILLSKYFFRYGVTFAVFGALLGVSISELASFIFLLVYFLIFSYRNKVDKASFMFSKKELSKKLIRLSFPITLGGLISPATSMIDSFLVVNLLMLIGYSNIGATQLLGLQSGVVEPLINLPVVISISLATVLLPNISSLIAEKNYIKSEQLIHKSFQICLCISMAFAISFIIFGEQILNFLYGKNFSGYELESALKLLFLGSINILFLSLVQITAGVLQGIGKPSCTVKSLIIGCVVKIILEVILVQIPAINIFGVIISAGVCYLIVFALNYNQIKKVINVNIWNVYKPVAIQESFVCIFAFFGNYIFKQFFNKTISLFISGGMAVLVFFVTYYIFFISNKSKNITLKFTKNIENKLKI